jgi:hypothetical protein
MFAGRRKHHLPLPVGVFLNDIGAGVGRHQVRLN